MITYRIQLYEISENRVGRYFHVTIQASSVVRAFEKLRETYPARIYGNAGVEVVTQEART